MRTLVLALLATTGCNSIFGVSKTDLEPADAIIPDAPYPRMSLAYQQLIGSLISYAPIAGATVQVGDYTHGLADAAVDAQGTFALPDPLTSGEYRIVYKLPGDPVTHEVQWSDQVVRDGGRITVPVFGRMPRTAPPTGSGYTLTANTYPASWDCQSIPTPCQTQSGINMTAYATGSWAALDTSFRRYTKSIGVAVPSMKALDNGAIGTAVPTDSDIVLAVSMSGPNANGVNLANAYAFSDVADLTANTYTMLSTDVHAIETNSAATTAFTPASIHQESAIMSALAALYNKSPGDADSITGAVVPSLAMPSMTVPSYDGSPDQSVAIPLATVATNDPLFVDCGLFFANPFTNHDQNTDALRPALLIYKQFRTRPAHATGTPVLYSGFQAFSPTLIANDCNTGLSKQPISVPVGIAASTTFTKLLSFDDTPVTLPQNGFQDLTFAINDHQDTTDDCVVTTYHVTTVLEPLRSILVPVRKQPMLTVHVPTSDFTAGETYAFGIVCRDGYPGAATGDYIAFAGYPQHESQIFPGTFVVSFQ